MIRLLFILAILAISFGCRPNSSSQSQNYSSDSGDSSGDVGKSNAYVNPVDGKTYYASEEWSIFHPEDDTNQAGTRIQSQSYRLLTPQSKIWDRSSLEEIVEFVDSTEALAKRILAPCTENTLVLVQFNCKPGEFTHKLMHQGGIAEPLLDEFHKNLSKLSPLPVSKDEVTFQVTIEVLVPKKQPGSKSSRRVSEQNDGRTCPDSSEALSPNINHG